MLCAGRVSSNNYCRILYKMDKNCRVFYNKYQAIPWEKQGYLPIKDSYIDNTVSANKGFLTLQDRFGYLSIKPCLRSSYRFMILHSVLELASSAPHNLLPHPGSWAQLLAALCCLSKKQALKPPLIGSKVTWAKVTLSILFS